MSQAIKYDAMCRAIANAHAVDKVKDIRDKAAALKAHPTCPSTSILPTYLDRLLPQAQDRAQPARIRFRFWLRLGLFLTLLFLFRPGRFYGRLDGLFSL